MMIQLSLLFLQKKDYTFIISITASTETSKKCLKSRIQW